MTGISERRARANGKPILLDAFCGAGGSAKGYQRAGFYVVGLDIVAQPHYCGDEFYQADALTYPLDGFDAIHASPPCQAYSVVANHSRDAGMEYPDLVGTVWWRLLDFDGPWVIENVPGAPLDVTLMLCGTMFEPPLRVRRHRIFESNVPLLPPQWGCRHKLFGPEFPIYEHGRIRYATTYRAHGANITPGAGLAMGIDWSVTRAELTQMIPPAYTQHIGKVLMALLRVA